MATSRTRTKPRAARPAVSAQLGDTETRARILQAAALVFAESGVQKTSVEDILKLASVARRTFYRHYDGKEGVMVEIYRMGTDRLLGACAIAVGEGATVFERVCGCIDAHLRGAREFGRLVFVLGGEAHRYESLLYTRRKEVHDALVRLLATATRELEGAPYDPLLLRALVLAMEGVTRRLLEEADEGRQVTQEGLDRARQVAVHVACSALGLRVA